MRRFLKKILVFPILVLFLNSCGGELTGAPPVSIPAPAPAKIRISSPDEAGLVTVTGSAGAVTGGATVRVTNVTAAGGSALQTVLDLLIRSAWAQAAATTVETVAAADGTFSVQIAAEVGDSLRVTAIDPDTGEESEAIESTVAANAPPLSFSPRAVITDSSTRGYAIGVSNGTGIVGVIDLENNVVLSTFNLDTNDPQNIAFSALSNKLVITDTTNNAVLFVDLNDTTNQNQVAVTGAQSVTVDALTRLAVVGTTDTLLSVVLIDLETETVTASGAITHATNPVAIYQGSPAVDALDGQAVFVSNFNDGSSQITTKDLTIPALTNFEALDGTSLQGAAMIRANEAVVVDESGDRIFFADLTGATSAVAVSVGASPRKVVVNSVDNQALVTNFDDHTVSVVGIATRTVADTLDVGINPIGIAFSAGEDRTLTGNSGDNSTTILE